MLTAAGELVKDRAGGADLLQEVHPEHDVSSQLSSSWETELACGDRIHSQERPRLFLE